MKRFIMNMNFDTSKTPAEVIKEGAFEGTYFKDISSGINGKLYRKSWKKKYVKKCLSELLLLKLL